MNVIEMKGYRNESTVNLLKFRKLRFLFLLKFRKLRCRFLRNFRKLRCLFFAKRKGHRRQPQNTGILGFAKFSHFAFREPQNVRVRREVLGAAEDLPRC